MKKSKSMKKKIENVFSLPISLRVTLKLSLRSRFPAKKHFFVFSWNFGFRLEKLSNQYSQLKKYVKFDPETRSYDFLTKTREKNPMSPNILILGMTLGFSLNCFKFQIELEFRILRHEQTFNTVWLQKCFERTHTVWDNIHFL